MTLDKKGELSLIARTTNDIPEYAILSHTWGAYGEEVNFEDLMNGIGTDKPGYDSQFCVAQANRDGLRY
jgi:hypothetical protein